MKALDQYSLAVQWSEEDKAYVATSAEFPGLSGIGDARLEAIEELHAAQAVALKAFYEDGLSPPAPQVMSEFSGQFRLRLPVSLHRELSERAAFEGVSLNSHILSVLAKESGRNEIGDRVTYTVRQSLFEIAELVSPVIPMARDAAATYMDPMGVSQWSTSPFNTPTKTKTRGY